LTFSLLLEGFGFAFLALDTLPIAFDESPFSFLCPPRSDTVRLNLPLPSLLFPSLHRFPGGVLLLLFLHGDPHVGFHLDPLLAFPLVLLLLHSLDQSHVSLGRFAWGRFPIHGVVASIKGWDDLYVGLWAFHLLSDLEVLVRVWQARTVLRSCQPRVILIARTPS
jgi:hypothetical protein